MMEIAELEGVDNSYVGRMVNLTTLAPDIVDAILQNALPEQVTLLDLAISPPVLWEEQRRKMGCSRRRLARLASHAAKLPWFARIGGGSPVS